MATYDELATPTGEIRPHWQPILQKLQQLGSRVLQDRDQETKRLLRQNGVTYSVTTALSQLHIRPWQLDPIPYVIAANEWQQLQQGLIQRAHLLNLILADIYGPRTLLQKGLIPAELLYAHDGFMRCFHDAQTNKPQQWLHLYAADIVRGEDGRFLVLGDRTQSPDGAGFALENRTVMRRIMPGLFREAEVHRLALFFRSMRNQHTKIAVPHDHGRTVILTPGPADSSYFEHSYLANYLGYDLVQGSDLTFRNGSIWLKSLNGLQPVNMILRRQADQLCDPLELQTDSIQGVPGLSQALRQGSVTMANHLGSSVLENPALQAYLPAICRTLLGEDLQLPVIASWWCGVAHDLEYVLAHFDELIIKPIAKHRGVHSLLPAEMSNDKRQQLLTEIQRNPHLYAAQARIRYSSTPTLIDGQLQPRSTIARMFLSSHNDSYIAMPGGLTRVISDEADWQLTNRDHVLSKDTWILANHKEPEISLWPETIERNLQSHLGTLPSRAADNQFWLGRNSERAEAFIRLCRTIIAKVDEIAEYQNSSDKYGLQQFMHAIAVLLQEPVTEYLQGDSDDRCWEAEVESTVITLCCDINRNCSLINILQAMLRSAYSVRDLLSADTWRIITHIEIVVSAWKKRIPTDSPALVEKLDMLIVYLSGFSGLFFDSTTADEGWFFVNIGRRLERGIWLCKLVESLLLHKQPQHIEQMLLQSLLISCESLMTYRRRHFTDLLIEPVLQLLLFDATNPRSLQFQLQRLQHTISTLPRPQPATEEALEQQQIQAALKLLQQHNTEQLCSINPISEQREELLQLVTVMADLLQAIADTITSVYFNHQAQPRQLNPQQ